MTNKDFEFITDKIGIWFANLKLKSFRHTFDGDIYPSSALVTDYELFIAKFKKDIKFNKDTILEEPVSELWHDSNKEQPKAESNVAIWDGESGEILTRCVKVNPNRKWAYMEDMLNKKEEPVSEDLEEAACNYGDELDNVLSVGIDDDNSIGEFATQAFKAGAQWNKDKLDKVIKLADAMYYAAFHMTTDASRLRKAMNDYHN